MAVLDILTLNLIDPNLAIENLTTGVGRVFHNQIKCMLSQPGLLQFYWGRHYEDFGRVGLGFVWEDETFRSAFQYSDFDFWALNKYLQNPMRLHVMRNVKPSQWLEQHDKYLAISIIGSKSAQSDLAWQTFEEHSRTYLTGLDVTHLQGHLCQLDTPYQIRQNSHSVNKDKSELQFVDLPYVSVTIVSDETYCRNLQHIKSTSNEIICLKKFASHTPVAASQDAIAATTISPLFVRDPSILKAPALQGDFEDIAGPRAVWRTPRDAYWLGDTRSFIYTNGPANLFKNTSPRDPPTLSPQEYGDSFFETLSFIFNPESRAPDGTRTPASDAYRAYRKCLYLHKQCQNVYLITQPSEPRLSELFVEWASSASAATFHSCPLTKTALLKLTPYLATTAPPSPSPHIPFHPRHNSANAEVIDFVLPTSASAAEKRAFLLYLEDFFEILERPSETCLDVINTLTAYYVGWIPETLPSPFMIHGGEASSKAPGGPTSTYRIFVCWDTEAEEAEWVRQWVQSPKFFGKVTQMIALIVERVVATRVRVRRDEWYLVKDEEDERIEREGGEELGF